MSWLWLVVPFGVILLELAALVVPFGVILLELAALLAWLLWLERRRRP